MRHRATQCSVGHFVTSGNNQGTQRIGRPSHAVAPRVKPVTTQAGRVRSPQHRIQYHSRMLRRPIVGITAVNGFVSASQVFTLLPKSAGDVDTGRSELQIDPPRHPARRNFSPNRSALTRHRKVRTLILLGESDHGPPVSPVCNQYSISQIYHPDDLRSHFSLVPNRSQGVERSCRPNRRRRSPRPHSSLSVRAPPPTR